MAEPSPKRARVDHEQKPTGLFDLPAELLLDHIGANLVRSMRPSACKALCGVLLLSAEHHAGDPAPDMLMALLRPSPPLRAISGTWKHGAWTTDLENVEVLHYKGCLWLWRSSMVAHGRTFYGAPVSFFCVLFVDGVLRGLLAVWCCLSEGGQGQRRLPEHARVPRTVNTHKKTSTSTATRRRATLRASSPP